MHQNHMNKFISYLSVIAVMFFSYIPFLYFFSIIKIEKYLIFILLISAILILTLFSFTGQILRGKIKFSQLNITALYLYMLFAIYALIRCFLTGETLNDLFTIRTLILVNPVFVILALLCLQNKKDVIRMITLLSGSYFIFLVVSFIRGNISLSSSSFQSIFIDMEGDFYQNINMYLGLFAICNISLLSSKKNYISKIPKILIPLSIIGMLFIGGRGAIVAITAVLLIYFFKESTTWSFKISDTLKQMILIFTLVLLLIFYFAEITKLFNDSVTLRRFIVLTEEGDSSKRIFLFSKALELFFSDIRTLLFGAGINSFPVYIGADSRGGYPHNIVLELLAEYGIIGTIFFTIPAIYVISIRKKILGSIYGNRAEEKIIFFPFIYFLVIHFFSGGLRNSWVLIFYLFLLLPSQNDVQIYSNKERVGQ